MGAKSDPVCTPYHGMHPVCTPYSPRMGLSVKHNSKHSRAPAERAGAQAACTAVRWCVAAGLCTPAFAVCPRACWVPPVGGRPRPGEKHDYVNSELSPGEPGSQLIRRMRERWSGRAAGTRQTTLPDRRPRARRTKFARKEPRRTNRCGSELLTVLKIPTVQPYTLHCVLHAFPIPSFARYLSRPKASRRHIRHGAYQYVNRARARQWDPYSNWGGFSPATHSCVRRSPGPMRRDPP